MNWPKAARILFKPALFILEYGFKLLAGVGTAIVLAAEGPFLAKLGAALHSFLPALQQIFRAPERIRNIGSIIEDYNTLTAAAFNDRYGGQAINHLLEQLNQAVAYIQAIYGNIVNQPVSTVTAALVTFMVLYLLARACRFARQRGQGSYVDRMERRLGDRVFRQYEGSIASDEDEAVWKSDSV
ncbi:hypothetical protein [Halalkalibaculum sp. DA384]|uniref:hypothetical protein n=1 Tax=Halalkalibaculum sp. DA384 TaxID=3373606 RepID=UPI003754693A